MTSRSHHSSWTHDSSFHLPNVPPSPTPVPAIALVHATPAKLPRPSSSSSISSGSSTSSSVSTSSIASTLSASSSTGKKKKKKSTAPVVPLPSATDDSSAYDSDPDLQPPNRNNDKRVAQLESTIRQLLHRLAKHEFVYDESKYKNEAVDMDKSRLQNGFGEQACANRRVKLQKYNNMIQSVEAEIDNDRQKLFRLMFKRSYLGKQIEGDLARARDEQQAKAERITLEVQAMRIQEEVKKKHAEARLQKQEIRMSHQTQMLARVSGDYRESAEVEPIDSENIEESDNEEDDDDQDADDVDSDGNVKDLVAKAESLMN